MNSPGLAVYRVLAGLLAPWMRRRLQRDVFADPVLRARQGERDGVVPAGAGELWLHAASLGEVAAAMPLIDALLRVDAARRIVISTVTATGAARVLERFGTEPRVRHLFAPLDTPGRVCRWLDATRPVGLLLVETELWPELLAQCGARGVPVAMVSARLSARAFARYRRVRGLFRPVLTVPDPVLCQDETVLARFAELGVDRSRLAVTGNLKRAVLEAPDFAPSAHLSNALHSRPAWLAGSVHPAEAGLLAAAHRSLIEALPGALLLVVPRHPGRAAAVAAAFQQAGLTVTDADESDVGDVLLCSGTGLLAGLYRHLAVALVGGSLAPGPGGHNLLEPAVAACAVLTGPHLDHQREAQTLLQANDALIEVNTAPELAARLRELLEQPERAREYGRRAQSAVTKDAQQVLETTLAALDPWLARFG
ncbi:MAG: glycosyltransferase N-terminal domain-containing protein [Wenzhouxiangellaceae bacterium]|nr:glycosyltransferase N-terminal domain-containing protein [Wenzhouxiangellaceae bacterium]